MSPECNADYAQSSVECERPSPLQCEIQSYAPPSERSCPSESLPKVRSASDASCESECQPSVTSVSDVCDSEYQSPVRKAARSLSDASSSFRKRSHINVDEEVQSTVEMFRRVADGDESIDNVMDEINHDRKALGLGSRRDRYYSGMISQKLIQEDLLPEMSFLYAKDNFSQMAKRGRITENSYANFRAEEADNMSPVDKLLSRYFINTLHRVEERGPLCFGKKYLALKDLDCLIDIARENRIEKAEQSEFKQVMSFLTEDNGKNFDSLCDERAGGITRRSLRKAYNSGADDRETLEKIFKNFREISLQDRVITRADIEYCSELRDGFTRPRTRQLQTGSAATYYMARQMRAWMR